ncbi:MAG: hydantoinase B/oxoprolinase family protein, partial [Cucumibacter sp.]
MPAGSDDPVTATVIQAGLVAAADEMFAVLKKTAMSPIIYEVLDVGTGVTDAHGALLSSGAGIPTFVGVLDKAVKRILALHGPQAIRDGDMFIINDPYFGGVTHLSDVVVALPVFHDGLLVAWTASIAHWNDIGGKTPGSMAVDVSEIFQEGLRLPAVRLFDAGTLLQSVVDIITVNSRLPDFVIGDLWAQIAASRRAATRVRGLVETFGAKAYRAALADMPRRFTKAACSWVSSAGRRSPNWVKNVLVSSASRRQSSGSTLKSSSTALREMFNPSRVSASGVGTSPMGVSVAWSPPWTRSRIHLRTRTFSPKPGHRNCPSAPLRNQFT